jgi:hypothetical protein
MKLILPTLFLLVQSVYGQEIYNFSKLGRSVYLTSDQRSVIFYPYESKGKARERKVMVNGIEYHFLITKTADGQRQDIVDGSNTILATTWLTGEKLGVIVLPDNSSYSMINPNKETWIYRKDGQDVVKELYKKVSGKKSLTIVVDPVVANQLPLQLACLERGTDFIVGKPISGPMFIAGLLVAILAALVNGSQH